MDPTAEASGCISSLWSAGWHVVTPKEPACTCTDREVSLNSLWSGQSLLLLFSRDQLLPLAFVLGVSSALTYLTNARCVQLKGPSVFCLSNMTVRETVAFPSPGSTLVTLLSCPLLADAPLPALHLPEVYSLGPSELPGHLP